MATRTARVRIGRRRPEWRVLDRCRLVPRGWACPGRLRPGPVPVRPTAERSATRKRSPRGDVDVRQVLAEAVGECGRPTVAAAPDAQLPDGTYEGEGAGLEFGLSAGAEDGRAGRVRAGQRAGADGSRCGRAEVGEVVFVLPYGGDGAGSTRRRARRTLRLRSGRVPVPREPVGDLDKQVAAPGRRAALTCESPPSATGSTVTGAPAPSVLLNALKASATGSTRSARSTTARIRSAV